ncbi:MAG: hypothetical protein PHP01_07485 [Phycisphaerae bacterium]|nr:hypothetical protein [Phycisphaerae bacterium]
MSEVKIARFLDIKACESIFSENSTFVLRSPEYYRRLCETTESGNTKGDRDEGSAKTVDGGTAEYRCFVLSCWTKLKGTMPTPDEWNIFKEDEQNIMAIISTPSKVCDFINKALETERTERRLPFWPVKHEEVKYGKAPCIDHTNIHKVVPFRKGEQFAKQEEYRFIMEYSSYPHRIDSYIFSGGIEYMEKRFANPDMNKEIKEKLGLILSNARAGDGDFSDMKRSEIIANADILFDK